MKQRTTNIDLTGQEMNKLRPEAPHKKPKEYDTLLSRLTYQKILILALLFWCCYNTVGIHCIADKQSNESTIQNKVNKALSQNDSLQIRNQKIIVEKLKLIPIWKER